MPASLRITTVLPARLHEAEHLPPTLTSNHAPRTTGEGTSQTVKLVECGNVVNTRESELSISSLDRSRAAETISSQQKSPTSSGASRLNSTLPSDAGFGSIPLRIVRSR